MGSLRVGGLISLVVRVETGAMRSVVPWTPVRPQPDARQSALCVVIIEGERARTSQVPTPPAPGRARPKHRQSRWASRRSDRFVVDARLPDRFDTDAPPRSRVADVESGEPRGVDVDCSRADVEGSSRFRARH